jgi:hypothetical protein
MGCLLYRWFPVAGNALAGTLVLALGAGQPRRGPGLACVAGPGASGVVVLLPQPGARRSRADAAAWPQRAPALLCRHPALEPAALVAGPAARPARRAGQRGRTAPPGGSSGSPPGPDCCSSRWRSPSSPPTSCPCCPCCAWRWPRRMTRTTGRWTPASACWSPPPFRWWSSTMAGANSGGRGRTSIRPPPCCRSRRWPPRGGSRVGPAVPSGASGRW